METQNKNNKEQTNPIQLNDDDASFENPSVDPGFEQEPIERELKKEESPDTVHKEVKKGDGQPQEDNGPEQDALNYKSDRENGSFNPKNI